MKIMEKHKQLNVLIMNDQATRFGYVDFENLLEDDQGLADVVAQEVYDMSLAEKSKLEKKLKKAEKLNE